MFLQLKFIKKHKNVDVTAFTHLNRLSVEREEYGGCGKGLTWEVVQWLPDFNSFSAHIEPEKSHSIVSTSNIIPTIMSITEVVSKYLLGRS